MKRKSLDLQFWLPRVLAIFFLIFLALFSLDIFEGNYGFWGTILGLLMHNIPVFILMFVLWISWKHEIVGGVVFIAVGLFYILMRWRSAEIPTDTLLNSIIIAGPALVIGILFLINWFYKKKS